MQRTPLFESDGFIYWKNRLETYMKSKDLDLWHVIIYDDFPPTENNLETKKDEIVSFAKQSDDIKKKLANNNEAKMVMMAVKDHGCAYGSMTIAKLALDALLRKKSSLVPPLEDAASNRFWIRGAWAAISNSVHHSQVIISGKQACKINEVQRRIYILCAKPTRIFGLTWKMPSYYFAFLSKKKTGNDIIFASGSPFKNVDLGNGVIGNAMREQ
ncbi:hypothetical protein Tco_1106300 [Tanacetum coccineum]